MSTVGEEMKVTSHVSRDDGVVVVEVAYQGQAAGKVEFWAEETVIRVPKSFTGWTKAIVKAARKHEPRQARGATPAREAAQAEADDIVV